VSGASTRLRVTGAVSAPGRVTCTIGAGCPRCARGEGCGQAGWFSRRERSVILELPTGARPVSAPVVLSLSASRLMRAAWLAYGLPLCGLLLGALAGHAAGGDPVSVPGAALGLVAGLAAGRLLARRSPGALLPELDEGASP
jgi:sigma-E factor negative regulatory protein RseC